MRTIRVLPPGPLTPAARPTGRDSEAAPSADPPVRTAQEPSAGYQQAVDAHRVSRRTAVVDPRIRAAAERQARSQAREPEHLFRDGRAVVEQLRERAARQGATDTTRARALRRLADERAGRVSSTPQRLEQPA
ncbi:hypothetical protein AB0O20_35395 [Streptomyces kronopolitis]|uniref:hypothetical protein n=1 Tax=Streptomyces kronopolitis TaxID=1612435 RepID=UPI00341D6FBB